LDKLKKRDVTQLNDESPQNLYIPLTHTQTGAVYVSCKVSGTGKTLYISLINTRNPEIPGFVNAIIFATRILYEKKKCVLCKAFNIKHSSAKLCCKGFGLTTNSKPDPQVEHTRAAYISSHITFRHSALRFLQIVLQYCGLFRNFSSHQA
jgi:hypothetical protein